MYRDCCILLKLTSCWMGCDKLCLKADRTQDSKAAIGPATQLCSQDLHDIVPPDFNDYPEVACPWDDTHPSPEVSGLYCSLAPHLLTAPSVGQTSTRVSLIAVVMKTGEKGLEV